MTNLYSSSIFEYWFDKMKYVLKPRRTLNASFCYGMLSDSSVKEKSVMLLKHDFYSGLQLKYIMTTAL